METFEDVIKGMYQFYRLDKSELLSELPQTLPDTLEKEFGEFFTTHQEDHDPDPQNHVNNDIKVQWDTICCIYERIRELIEEGKI